MSYYGCLRLVILSKIKHHPRRKRAVLKGDVQTLGLWELDSNAVLKLVLTHCVRVEPKRPYAAYGAVAQELRRYHVTVEYDGLCPFG